MDYFTKLLATFVDLDHGNNYIAVYRRVRELTGCTKMNEGLTGLEQHEGE